MTLQELAELQKEQLSKQLPVTLEEAREQFLRVSLRDPHILNKEENIKKHLKIYYPDWTKTKIEAEYKRLMQKFRKWYSAQGIQLH